MLSSRPRAFVFYGDSHHWTSGTDTRFGSEGVPSTVRLAIARRDTKRMLHVLWDPSTRDRWSRLVIDANDPQAVTASLIVDTQRRHRPTMDNVAGTKRYLGTVEVSAYELIQDCKNAIAESSTSCL